MLSKINQWLKSVISGETKVEEQPVVSKPQPASTAVEGAGLVPIASTTAAKKAPAKKAPAAKKAVKVKEVLVKPKFEAGSLDNLSKTELVEFARKNNIKISPRMGKAAIIKKMMS
jgi:hypothetical protein